MLYSTAIVNIGNIKYNIKQIKKLTYDKKFIAVVKSNAYGHGLVGVSTRIDSVVDGFAIAHIDEGVKLRYAGIKKPIYCLIPPSVSEISLSVRYGIIICIDGVKRLKSVINFCKNYGYTAQVQIAVNSGMNRFGIDDISKLKTLISIAENSKVIQIVGIFSHFYNTGNVTDCEKQYGIFMKFVEIIKNYDETVIAHISSSGGLLLKEKYLLDAVRVGIMLYGYKPFESDKITLKPALKVIAEKVTTRFLRSGENLMYGDFTLRSDKIVDVLAYGYADGLSRKGFLSSENNLCMDACASKGRAVLISADELAKKLGTIPYEILVNATRRSQFVYLDK